MLKNTFCHLPHIGIKTEQKLWQNNIHNWSDATSTAATCVPGNKNNLIQEQIKISTRALKDKNALFFQQRLPASQAWRIYKAFCNDCAYIDIETTGLNARFDQITTIALYGKNQIKTYVCQRNLQDFLTDIKQFSLIVSFNGKTFDLPFIEKYFNTKLDIAHLDLRYILKQTGLSGGLKAIEKELGINRKGLEDVDGYFAVLLWNEFQKTNNEAALETLLAYNIEDVVHLEELMIYAWNKLTEQTPFYETQRMNLPQNLPPNLYQPDEQLIKNIKKRYNFYY